VIEFNSSRRTVQLWAQVGARSRVFCLVFWILAEIVRSSLRRFKTVIGVKRAVKAARAPAEVRSQNVILRSLVDVRILQSQKRFKKNVDLGTPGMQRARAAEVVGVVF
jgi:hypothetical protein